MAMATGVGRWVCQELHESHHRARWGRFISWWITPWITPLSFEEIDDKDGVGDDDDDDDDDDDHDSCGCYSWLSRDENPCCTWANPISENHMKTGRGQRLPCIAPGARGAAESAATHGRVWGTQWGRRGLAGWEELGKVAFFLLADRRFAFFVR